MIFSVFVAENSNDLTLSNVPEWIKLQLCRRAEHNTRVILPHVPAMR